MAKDLICGMDVDEKKAKFKTDYMGKTYYFCSAMCKQKFDANPQNMQKHKANSGFIQLQCP
jgi:YHS domain-containing protein